MTPATPSSILRHDGVLAVVVTANAGFGPVNPDAIGSAGDAKLVEIGAWALTGFALDAVGGEDSARYIVGKGKYSVMLERAPQGSVALVLTAGHPVVKSARRMARRLLRAITAKPARTS
jgi:hypothetical protein